jgi:hypothetical protein
MVCENEITMEFEVRIKVDHKIYRMWVKRVHADQRKEQFLVTGGKKSIIVENNRPFFRNKGLKHRKPDWKLIEGDVKHAGSLQRLYDEMLDTIEWINKMDGKT